MKGKESYHLDYTKAMIDIFKHLSTISISLIVAAVILDEKMFFEIQSFDVWVLKYTTVFFYLMTLIFSYVSMIKYSDCLLDLERIREKPMRKDIWKSTGLVFSFFSIGGVCLVSYFIVGVLRS